MTKFSCLAFAAATLSVCLSVSDASAAVVISKDVRGPATWDAFTVTTLPSTTTGFDNIGIDRNNTTGLGQSFTVTESGNIDAISFGVLRMYNGGDGAVDVYRMFDGDGVSPGANPTRFRNGNADWMSESLLNIPFNTAAVNINNSGDGNNMYTFSLSGADQLAVTAGETYMVRIAGTGATGDDLMLWEKLNAGTYDDGTYGVPLGGSTAVGGRDAFLAVNISAAAVPEPASLAFLGLGAVGVIARRRRSRCTRLSL